MNPKKPEDINGGFMQQDPGFGPKICGLEAQSRSEKIALNSVLWGSSTVAMGSLAMPGPPGHPGNACDGKPTTGCIVQACVALEAIWHWPVAVVQDI
jgi:hypothetical protein